MRINHNITALNAYRQLSINNTGVQKSLEKLASGMRINRAGDDAAGLAISEKMRGQIKGLTMASKNAQDGISLIQTAEGALNEVHSILQRMRELAVQSANDTMTDDDRKELQKELNQLIDEIDRIAQQTEFNTKKLLDGTFASTALKFHIGANTGQSMDLTIGNMQTTAIGVYNDDDGKVDTTLDSLKDADLTGSGGIQTQEAADAAIDVIDGAIKMVSAERAKLGAYQNRLEHTINNLEVAAENLTAAESRIRDVDMAKEMMEFTKQTILQQAATAMLAQANQLPQAVLQLLR